MDIKQIRVKKLKAFVDSNGGAAEIARKYESVDASYLSQLINGHRSFGEKAARKMEGIFNLPQFSFDALSAEQKTAPYILNEINLKNNDDYPAIKRVNLKLSAGIIGYGVDFDVDDKTPIVMQKEWFLSRGYKPESLIATKIKGESMQPGLYDGDTIVINTAETTPIDGNVYAVNYEGELIVKRMTRDLGTWWLCSDNPDQRRFPKKECTSDLCLIIGKIVHKQSEHI